MGRFLHLPPLVEIERQTLRLILPATMMTGLLDGLLLILPEIARRSLGAERQDLVYLTLLWPIGQLFAIYWASYLATTKRRPRLILLTAICSRLPMCGVAFCDSIGPMFPFFFLHAFTQPLFVASHHSAIQANFRPKSRGTLYSVYLMLYTFTLLSAVLGYGAFLDLDEQHYRHLAVFIAMAGLLEAILLSRIRLAPRPQSATPGPAFQTLTTRVFGPWRAFLALFKGDRDFFRYELYFFVYGLGFMFMQPFITLFLVNSVGLNYTQISLAKSTILYSGILMLAPFAGRLFDRKNPILFAGITFALIALFPIILIVTGLLPHPYQAPGVYIAYGVFSIGWTFMQFTWNLGAMFFAKDRDVSLYTGAHIAMVGLRGLMAFAVLAVVVNDIEPPQAFSLGAVAWFVAALLMFHFYLTRYRKNTKSIT